MYRNIQLDAVLGMKPEVSCILGTQSSKTELDPKPLSFIINIIIILRQALLCVGLELILYNSVWPQPPEGSDELPCLDSLINTYTHIHHIHIYDYPSVPEPFVDDNLVLVSTTRRQIT